MKKLTMILVSIGLLAGCGAAPDGAEGDFEESVAEESAALATGPFTLRNYQTGLCLGAKAGGSSIGTPLITWYCDGSANQKWRKNTFVNDAVHVGLSNGVASNRCLVTGVDNGSPATLGDCIVAAHSSVGWKPIYAGTDQAGHECYRFARKTASSKVFGVKGGSTALNTPIILWEDYGGTHPDQLWCVY